MAEYYKTLDDVVAAVKSKFDSAAKAKIDSYNADIDKATAIAMQNAPAAEETIKQGYEDVFRKNRLNQIINEEKTKERMASLGLTDSGLNRTQQTAIQLQAANADAAAVRNRQAAIDEIRRGITEFTAQQEAKKNDYARETNDLAHQNMMSEATSIWNTQLENQQKAAEAKREAYNSLMETLNDSSISNEYKKAALIQYATDYCNGDINQVSGLMSPFGFKTKEETDGRKSIIHQSEAGSEHKDFDIVTNNWYNLYEATAGEFKPSRKVNDDFMVMVNGKKYKIEERGSVPSGTPIYEALKNTETDDKTYNLIKYNGELYLKAKNDDGSHTFYNLGNGSHILDKIKNDDYDKLNKLLQNN